MDRLRTGEVRLGASLPRAASGSPGLRALALTSSAFATGHGRAQSSDAAARLVAQALHVGCSIRWLTPRAYVAVAHPSRPEQLWLRGLAREDPAGIGGVFDTKVRQTRQPAVLSRASSALLRLWASPVYWPYLESHEVRALVVLPLYRPRVVGVMTAWREQPHPAFTGEEVTFLEEVARRLALS